ncbi:MAG: (2Fe-2S)-binding protein, partial [Nitrospinaceae bacterium]
MANETVTLTIDDKIVTVPRGTKVVDAAKTVGIEIPVFCYHEKLGPFGCCRMCLVEVEKMPKMVTACTLDVGPDMVVKTNTEKVEKAQKGVLEFTLLNHPLDCPVCDKGGECPLQDNTFKFGPPDTRMEFDRAHNLKAAPLSPVITLDRERCIACQRCTRYSDIIEDERALVMLNRGFHNEIGTFNNEPYATRFSGNVIDICPVGALTNTQFRFKARTWDLTNSDTLCSHCGVNCNMTMGTRTNKFMRIQSRPNDGVDDGWICDKARWGYDFLESKNRIGMNKSKLGGDWKEYTPREAAAHVAEAFKKIADEHGPASIGFIGSPYGTNEELYLYQKLFRLGLGTNNIDHKTYPGTASLPIAHHDLVDIETSDLVVLLASDPAEELPILELRLKKVAKRGGVKLVVLNDQTTSMDRYAELSARYNVGAAAAVCEALAAELADSGASGDIQSRTGIDGETIKALGGLIRGSRKATLVYNPVPLSAAAHGPLHRWMSAMGRIPELSCGALPAAPYT